MPNESTDSVNTAPAGNHTEKPEEEEEEEEEEEDEEEEQRLQKITGLYTDTSYVCLLCLNVIPDAKRPTSFCKRCGEIWDNTVRERNPAQ